MTKGTIIKGIGGFYYVKTLDAVIECKARGLFRKDGHVPMVGDEVSIEIQKDGNGYIQSIQERINEFVRPPVSNIEQMVVVVALADPEPNFDIIDKFLVAAEQNEVDILLVFNKLDIGDESLKSKVRTIYEPIYPVFFVCGKTGEGIASMKEALGSNKTAFAGPSGVGKSTLINFLVESADMQTGVISQKTKRGKHTTRHVELIQTEFGAKIFDTPGFTSFEVANIEKEDLDTYFPEIEPLRGSCKFKGCSHIAEPDCAVKAAVTSEEVSQSRYDSYVSQYKAIRDRKIW